MLSLSGSLCKKGSDVVLCLWPILMDITGGYMKNWHDVIEQSKQGVKNNIYVFDDNKQKSQGSKAVVIKKTHALAQKNYFIGERYPGLYFTRREAECLFYLLRGLTIASTAKMLDLSPRTVEFYVKNMKVKLGVKSKVELIDELHAIGFMNRLKDEGV